jgi:hypothetical protein
MRGEWTDIALGGCPLPSGLQRPCLPWGTACSTLTAEGMGANHRLSQRCRRGDTDDRGPARPMHGGRTQTEKEAVPERDPRDRGNRGPLRPLDARGRVERICTLEVHASNIGCDAVTW